MLPKIRPRARTGAPRSDCIGGWWCREADRHRMRRDLRQTERRRLVISSPRMPCPVGGSPISARSSSVIPSVMNSWIRPSVASTLSAPYRATVMSTASSTIRCRTASRERSTPAPGRPRSQVIAISDTIGHIGSLSGRLARAPPMGRRRTRHWSCDLRVVRNYPTRTGGDRMRVGQRRRARSIRTRPEALLAGEPPQWPTSWVST